MTYVLHTPTVMQSWHQPTVQMPCVSVLMAMSLTHSTVPVIKVSLQFKGNGNVWNFFGFGSLVVVYIFLRLLQKFNVLRK